MPKIKTALLSLLTLACAACSPAISPDGHAALDKNVRCSTAKKDLALLREERASAGQRLKSGVRSVLPIAAVISILRGEYRDGVKVATGQYNNDIDAKIEEIKKTCGVE